MINKYTCGEIAKSHHLYFTGTVPTFLDITDLERNLNTQLFGLGSEIDNILSNINTLKLNSHST